jgi:molybdenum cofactor cytidylyltransferase
MSPKKFSALILAAGTSSRFGMNKLLLPFGGKTVLESTIGKFCLNEIDEIIVVGGAFMEDFKKAIHIKKVKWILNSDYKKGMSSSLRIGLSNLQNGSDGVFVTPADMPLFKTATVKRMIAKFEKGKILIPTFGKKKGHPVLLDRELFDKFASYRSDKILYDGIQRNLRQVELIDVDDEGILVDLDLKEDYEKIRHRTNE